MSLSYRPDEDWAVKFAYARTTQYVHQLSQSYLALPTDQWIPISGKLKPETADKISVGGYWESPDKTYAVSVEGYYKWMDNLVEYKDEYYLRPLLIFGTLNFAVAKVQQRVSISKLKKYLER